MRSILSNVSRKTIITILSVTQALVIAALAVRKPHLSWNVLVLPVFACLIAFQIESQRRSRAAGGGRVIDWLGTMWIGVLVYDLVVSIVFLAT